MSKRVISESAAKILIYLLFSLSLFAFLMFWRGAQSYHAAVPADESENTSAAIPAVSASPPAYESTPATTTAEVAAGPVAEDAGSLSLPASEASDASSPASTTEEAASTSEDAAATEDEPALVEERAADVSAPATPAVPLLPAVPREPNPDIKNENQAAAFQARVPINRDALAAEMARIQAMGFTLSALSEPEYMGVYHTTSYCCEAYRHICGGNGVTASGTVPTQGLTVAADWSYLPKNTWLYIEGVGIRRVEDTGSAIKQKRLDVAVDTHDNALRWPGFGRHNVWVLAWG